METKKCSKCGEVKGVEQYNKNGKRKDGRQVYRTMCKNCSKGYYQSNTARRIDYGRAYYQKNKEHVKEYNKEQYQKNKERVKEHNKEHYQMNKEHIKETSKAHYQKNKEHKKEYDKKYRRTPAGKSVEKAGNSKRRALETGAPYSTSIYKQYLLTKSLLNSKCAYCGARLCGNDNLEHVVPLHTGGTHTPDNIVCSCKSCNSSKHTKPMEQWYREQLFFDPVRLLAIEAIQAYWRGEDYEVIIPSKEEIEQAHREAEGTLDTLSYIKTAPAELIISEI